MQVVVQETEILKIKANYGTTSFGEKLKAYKYN